MDFSTAQAARLARVDFEILKAWLKIGLVAPSQSGPAGSPRRFSFRDLVALRAASYLRNAGVSPRKMKRAISYLKARSGLSSTEVLAGTVLLTDGHDVYEVADNVAFSTLEMPGQAALAIVPLSRLVHDLQVEVQAEAESLRTAV